MDGQFVAHRKIQDYSHEQLGATLLRCLRVGDILLTSSSTETVRPIVAFQNIFSQFPPASRKFTHVAIYVGNGEVVHSMPRSDYDSILGGGVERSPLEDLLPEGTTFVVLRSPLVEPVHYGAIIDAASFHLGAPYDYRAIGRAISHDPDWMFEANRMYRALLSVSSKGAIPIEGPLQVRDVARAFVCSDLVYVVFDELFQQNNPCNYQGGNPSGGMWMPCAFYANPKLVDVVIE